MHRTEAIELSVAIVTFRSDCRLVCATLASLARALDVWRTTRAPGARVRVLLIDNGAASEPLPALESLLGAAVLEAFDELVLLPMKQNLGYGQAHNLILERGPGTYHLVLNPDLEMQADALCAGMDYLALNPEVVCVVPEGRDDEGKALFLAKRYPTLLVLLLRAFAPVAGRRVAPQRLARYEMADVCAAGAAAEVELASGCFMLLRGAAFVRAGGFSDRYFLYFEDFDLSLRLASIGRIVYLPAMRVLHHGGGAAGKGLRHVLLFCRSAAIFFNRHGWHWF